MTHLFKRLVQTPQVTGQLVLAFMVAPICYDAIMLYVFTAPTSWSGAVGADFCGIIAWRRFLIASQALEYGERVSSSFGTPMVLPYALLPIGFGTLALQFFINMADAIFRPDNADGDGKQDLQGIWGDPMTAAQPIICEVAPRDGFQSIAAPLPTAEKITMIRDLAAAGCQRIEIGSFVTPKAAPQMSDMAQITQAVRDMPVRLSALVPNARGAENARAAGVWELVYVVSVSDAHNQN